MTRDDALFLAAAVAGGLLIVAAAVLLEAKLHPCNCHDTEGGIAHTTNGVGPLHEVPAP